jgi:hypothetical protein
VEHCLAAFCSLHPSLGIVDLGEDSQYLADEITPIVALARHIYHEVTHERSIKKQIWDYVVEGLQKSNLPYDIKMCEYLQDLVGLNSYNFRSYL